MNFRGTSKYQKFSERMEKKTHFSRTEIDRLTDLHRTTMVSKNLSNYAFSNSYFQKDDKYRSKMDRQMFREFLHDKLNMTDDIIMDRIFKYFNKVSTDDIDMEEWIMGFNIFLKGIRNALENMTFD